MIRGAPHTNMYRENIPQTESPPTKKSLDLRPPVGFTVIRETRFKYYPRTTKLCIQLEGSYVNIPVSFSAMLWES